MVRTTRNVLALGAILAAALGLGSCLSLEEGIARPEAAESAPPPKSGAVLVVINRTAYPVMAVMVNGTEMPALAGLKPGDGMEVPVAPGEDVVLTVALAVNGRIETIAERARFEAGGRYVWTLSEPGWSPATGGDAYGYLSYGYLAYAYLQ
jgi:hypothetical protein